MTVGIMALVAQAEREATFRRSKEALAVAQALGVRLRSPSDAAPLIRAGKGGAPLRTAVIAIAERHAEDMTPVLEGLRSEGVVTLRSVAAELTERGMLMRRRGRWWVSNVRNLL